MLSDRIKMTRLETFKGIVVPTIYESGTNYVPINFVTIGTSSFSEIFYARITLTMIIKGGALNIGEIFITAENLDMRPFSKITVDMGPQFGTGWTLEKNLTTEDKKYNILKIVYERYLHQGNNVGVRMKVGVSNNISNPDFSTTEAVIDIGEPFYMGGERAAPIKSIKFT